MDLTLAAQWKPVETAPRDGTTVWFGGTWDDPNSPTFGDWHEILVLYTSYHSIKPEHHSDWYIRDGLAIRLCCMAITWTHWRPYQPAGRPSEP